MTKKKQILEEKIENINTEFWTNIDKLNDKSEHRFNARDLWGPDFSNINDNEIKIVFDNNQGTDNIRIELAFDNKDQSEHSENMVQDQPINDNFQLDGYEDDYYGTSDKNYSNVNIDEDTAANKIHNWWRKKNTGFWDRKNNKKIKIEYNNNVVNNNQNRDSKIQSYANTPKPKTLTPNVKSQTSSPITNNNFSFPNNFSNNNKLQITNNNSKKKLNIDSMYTKMFLEGIEEDSQTDDLEKEQQKYPIYNNIQPEISLGKRGFETFGENRQQESLGNNIGLNSLVSNFRKEFFQYLPLKVQPFLHYKKDITTEQIDNIVNNTKSWFEIEKCDRHVQVQAFGFPNLKSTEGFPELEKHLKRIHPSVGINDQQYYSWETSLNIMIQVRMYIRMKGSDHKKIMDKFLNKFEEEKSKNNQEFQSNFDYSDPNNIEFKLKVSFFNKINKKCIEIFDQLGSNLQEKEIVYLQNNKLMNRKIKEEKLKDFNKHVYFSNTVFSSSQRINDIGLATKSYITKLSEEQFELRLDFKFPAKNFKDFELIFGNIKII